MATAKLKRPHNVHQSPNKIKPTGYIKVNNTDHLATVQCTAGKPWTLVFTRVLLDRNDLPKKCRPGLRLPQIQIWSSSNRRCWSMEACCCEGVWNNVREGFKGQRTSSWMPGFPQEHCRVSVFYLICPFDAVADRWPEKQGLCWNVLCILIFCSDDDPNPTWRFGKKSHFTLKYLLLLPQRFSNGGPFRDTFTSWGVYM